MFETLKPMPPDPILGISAEFRKNTSPSKVNLSVGVYADESGKTPTFDVVRAAEKEMWNEDIQKTYLPILGTPEYLKATRKWITGNEKGHIVTSYSPGGTGGIRTVAELIALIKVRKVWIGNPTWGNHFAIFNKCGFECIKYDHVGSDGGFNFDGFAERAENEMGPGEVVLMHVCCHNPTGVDPTPEQWDAVIDLCKRKKALLLLDFPYQGFAVSSEVDRAPVVKALARLEQVAISFSFSKVMGLYCERVGALLVKARDEQESEILKSNLSSLVRQSTSNPSAHGLKIVEKVLGDDARISNWQAQLTQFRQRLGTMRLGIKERLGNAHPYYAGIENFHGLFGMFPITKEQALKLRSDYSIFLLDNGRVNLAGLNNGNIDYVTDAFKKVCFA